jgi:hypothetical protein
MHLKTLQNAINCELLTPCTKDYEKLARDFKNTQFKIFAHDTSSYNYLIMYW